MRKNNSHILFYESSNFLWTSCLVESTQFQNIENNLFVHYFFLGLLYFVGFGITRLFLGWVFDRISLFFTGHKFLDTNGDDKKQI